MRSIAISLVMLCFSHTFAQNAVPVTVQTLSSVVTPILFDAPAEVVSVNHTEISSRIEAGLMEIPARVGEVAEAGDELVILDCSDHQIELRRAEADFDIARSELQNARQKLDRARSLAEQKLLSDDVLDQRIATLNSAEARLRRAETLVESAQLAVSRCVITSPFRAVVTKREAAVGELATPGSALLHLVDIGNTEVSAQIFPSEHQQLLDSPRILLDFQNRMFPLVLARSVGVIDRTSRTMEVRLNFSEDGAPVGASGRLIWEAVQPGIPARLMVERNGRLGIFLENSGTATFHPLERALEGRPAIVDLPSDTRIVTEGQHGLRDGDTLQVN